MRAAFRRRSREDEEESVFVSMTDMTVSFLFILMIMLAFFASQFNPEDSVTRSEYDQVVQERDLLRRELAVLRSRVAELEAEVKRLLAELSRKDPVEEYLKFTAQVRQKILQNLRDRLRVDFPDLMIEISQEQDALRFQGDGLFASGESVLREDKRRIVETVAARLEEILPCYTFGPQSNWAAGCGEGAAIIEAVQIEGHTDATGDDRSNLDLSTRRANETFWAMLGREPTLVGHLNFREQPVLSVAGYGEMRPIADNATPAGRATNRRIDLRIIMYTPTVSGEIDEIRARLGALPADGAGR